MTDKERIARYSALNLTPAEKLELLQYDKEVEAKGSTVGKLEGEQAKTAKKMTTTGTRAYKFNKREKKEDKTKEKIIAAVRTGVETAFNVTTELENPSRQFSFSLDGETYDITLIRRRAKK